MDDEDEIKEDAREIVQEMAEMGDRGARIPEEDQTCARCDRNAAPTPPTFDEWLCRKHQKEHFRERHG